MVHGHHHHLSAGSLGRSSSASNRKSNESDGKGVFSRVLGNLKRRSHEKDEKEEEESHVPAWKQRQDWIANYECTHHPDRPRVDKQTQEVLSDVEYAAKLQRLQERSERYHGLSHRRSKTPPRINTNIPNFSYSSKSPKSNRESARFGSIDSKAECPPNGHETSKEHNPRDTVSSSTVSPGAMTIQVYRASAMDRGPIVRHSTESNSNSNSSINQGPLLPRKAYNPNESRKHHDSRKASSSSHKKAASTDSRIATAAEPAHHRGLGITFSSSDPDTSSAQTALETDTSRRTSASLQSPRKCPWPDCGAVLVSAQEQKDNLCASCHEALYPRESAFFGPRDHKPAAATEGEMQALQALVGSRADTDSWESAGENKEQGQSVDRSPVMYDFKLQPAPLGKRRRLPGPGAGAEHRNRSERRLSHISRRMSIVSPLFASRSRRRRSSVQDTRTFAERKTAQADANVDTNGNGYVSSSKGKGKEKEKEPDSHDFYGYWSGGGVSSSGEEYHSFHSQSRSQSRSRSRSPNDDSSWTTDTLSTSSSDASAPLQPQASSNKDYSDIPRFVPPNTAERNSRDSALYQEIEDIIDSYIGDGRDKQRKASAVASFYTKEPTAVRMRREGFF
ncbi:hypothetical protein F5Y04DRAFT_288334 [Hypomontagnella monticulosa]|nr:hypothetical protein F5Y04DRAFT_288334 [Hypomontagnella monticulosa]